MPKAEHKSCSEHYREHQSLLCSNRRNRYRLAEPKRRVKDLYANVTQRNLVLDDKARIEVVKVVRKRFPIVVKRNLVSRIASGYAARRLVNKSLRVRKEHAGNLLKATSPFVFAKSMLATCSRLPEKSHDSA